MQKIFILFAFLIFVTPYLLSQWSNDPSVNTPICTKNNSQGEPKIINDGQGGYIIVWVDGRDNNPGLYAQRINSDGIALWEIDGVLVNSVPNARYDEYAIISDGFGGCIVAWEEDGSGPDRVFAQRLNSSGIMLWTANGILVCANMSVSPELIGDGFGGAIITWEDWRITDDQNIYAQRINSTGDLMWTINGIAVCSAVNNQKRPKITSDGNNGAILVWRDYRNNLNDNIYAQRISSLGIPQWNIDGTPVLINSFDKYNLSIITDDSNGAIIAWSEYLPVNNDYDIYSQRINSAGIIQWQPTGVPIDTSQSRTYHKEISQDGSNGAVFTWIREDENEYKVYTQRINSIGNLLWGTNGTLACTENGRRYSSNITSDGVGGAIITWSDYRKGELNEDIYAQRINASGQINWTVNGVAVSIADSSQSDPNIIGTETGGAIIVWEDSRNGWDNADIYAQKINSDGSLGGTTAVRNEISELKYFLLNNYPNPFNPLTIIKFSIPQSELVKIKVYDILGKEVNTILNEFKHAGTYEVEFDASYLPSGVYFYRMISGSYAETKKMILLR